MYLEFGIVPIRFLIKVRRLLYLKWVLQEPEDSLVYRFLQIMIKKPLVGDWINLVKQDLKDFEVNLTFDEIKRISKQEFKDKIKQKMSEKAFEYLILIKEKQSKLKDIVYNKFETQHYLLPESGFSKTEMSNAMWARSRTIPVKANFRTAHPNMECRGCGTTEESQPPLLRCAVLNENSVASDINDNYDDLFSDNKTKLQEISNRLSVQNRKLQALISAPSDPPQG